MKSRRRPPTFTPAPTHTITPTLPYTHAQAAARLARECRVRGLERDSNEVLALFGGPLDFPNHRRREDLAPPTYRGREDLAPPTHRRREELKRLANELRGLYTGSDLMLLVAKLRHLVCYACDSAWRRDHERRHGDLTRRADEILGQYTVGEIRFLVGKLREEYPRCFYCSESGYIMMV